MNRQIPWSSLSWVTGLFMLFFGERVLIGEASAGAVSLVGLLLLSAATARQALLLRRAEEPARAGVHRLLAVSGAIGLLSLLIYLVSLQAEAPSAALQASWPILLLGSTSVLLMVEVSHTHAPVVVQPRRIAHVRDTAILTALALTLVFPLNFLAVQKNHRWDVTYFKTSAAGSATLSLVESLQDPVTVRIFQEPGSETIGELRAYFEPLEGPMLEVQVLDHAAEPLLVEQLKIPDNGYVAVSLAKSAPESSESADDEASAAAPPTETFQVSGEWDRAKKTLKILDGKFYQTLAEVVKGERVLYLTTGHREMALRGTDDPTQRFKLISDELKSRGFQVKNLEREDLVEGVPEDAASVVVLGARDPFVEAELASLRDFQRRGGSLMVALRPELSEEEPTLAPLLDLVGVEQERGVLADERRILPTPPFPRPRPADRVNIITGTFSSHPITTTLSESAGSRNAGILFPRSSALQKNTDFSGKHTVALRSTASNWMDLNSNLELDDESNSSAASEESKGIRNLAAAIEGEGDEGPWKAVVFASSDAFSDFWVRLSPGAALLLMDSVAWLTGDEDDDSGFGEIEDEKDPVIVHRTEDNLKWFYGTVFFIPLLVFLTGLLRLRRRRSGTASTQRGDA